MTLEELYRAKAQCVAKLRAYGVYANDKGIRIPYQDKFATPEYVALIKGAMDELHNVIGEKRYARKVRRFQKKLAKIRAEVGSTEQ